MNLLLLLLGLRPWSAPTTTSCFTRVFLAVSILSIEMQLVTWTLIGSLRSLALLNLPIAAGLWFLRLTPPPVHGITAVPPTRAVPWPVVLAMAALVLVLNLGLPIEAADPYHLEKVDRIASTGTLAYDPGIDPKINLVGFLYELLLADLRQLPVAGPTLVRLHGLLGLALYLLALASVRELLRAQGGWLWALLLAVPVLFHQLVLIKNDLLVGVLSFVAIAWIVTRAKSAPWQEIAWATWLAVLAVAIKISAAPLLLVLGGALLLQRRDGWRPFAGAALGGLLGVVAGGLLFSLAENFRLYGSLMPLEGIGDRHAGPMAALVGMARFGVSLFDLGLFTRVAWPGRGGWGGTFGLPLMWALVVLIVGGRHLPTTRTSLLCTGICFLAFAAIFPDADLSHRLVLGPGLFLVAVGVETLPRVDPRHQWLRLTTAPVLVLSGAQILRSAALYFTRS